LTPQRGRTGLYDGARNRRAIRMDPIAKTAYYCCGVRAADARNANPICGDHLAARFMDDEGRAVFEPFARLGPPNAASAARHRIIDDLLRDRLHAQHDRLVVTLGAGFDTRPYRLHDGRWVELDTAPTLALKEQKLPVAESPNPLQRVPIDFARDTLSDRLAQWSGARDAIVVMEGVSMYLDDAAWRGTAAALHERLPGHTLICDLMNAHFERLYGQRLRREVRKLGGDFTPSLEDPVSWVVSLGYRPVSAQSISGRAVDHGSVKVPRFLLDTLFRSLRDGYRVHVFDAEH
jgi:methyltransferase (TIGR00027 family)